MTGHGGVALGRVGRDIALPLWQMGQVAAYPLEQVAALPLGQKVFHQ